MDDKFAHISLGSSFSQFLNFSLNRTSNSSVQPTPAASSSVQQDDQLQPPATAQQQQNAHNIIHTTDNVISKLTNYRLMHLTAEQQFALRSTCAAAEYDKLELLFRALLTLEYYQSAITAAASATADATTAASQASRSSLTTAGDSANGAPVMRTGLGSVSNQYRLYSCCRYSSIGHP